MDRERQLLHFRIITENSKGKCSCWVKGSTKQMSNVGTVTMTRGAITQTLSAAAVGTSRSLQLKLQYLTGRV